MKRFNKTGKKIVSLALIAVFTLLAFQPQQVQAVHGAACVLSTQNTPTIRYVLNKPTSGRTTVAITVENSQGTVTFNAADLTLKNNANRTNLVAPEFDNTRAGPGTVLPIQTANPIGFSVLPGGNALEQVLFDVDTNLLSGAGIQVTNVNFNNGQIASSLLSNRTDCFVNFLLDGNTTTPTFSLDAHPTPSQENFITNLTTDPTGVAVVNRDTALVAKADVGFTTDRFLRLELLRNGATATDFAANPIAPVSPFSQTQTDTTLGQFTWNAPPPPLPGEYMLQVESFSGASRAPSLLVETDTQPIIFHNTDLDENRTTDPEDLLTAISLKRLKDAGVGSFKGNPLFTAILTYIDTNFTGPNGLFEAFRTALNF
jgi:hypothetical protein